MYIVYGLLVLVHRNIQVIALMVGYIQSSQGFEFKHMQGLKIDVHCVHTCTYFYLNMRMLTCMPIFSLRFFKFFKIFLVLIILYCLKTYCYTFDIYLFVLGRDRYFTAYICSKESLFFNFLYKLLINISLYLRALANLGCQHMVKSPDPFGSLPIVEVSSQSLKSKNNLLNFQNVNGITLIFHVFFFQKSQEKLLAVRI